MPKVVDCLLCNKNRFCESIAIARQCLNEIALKKKRILRKIDLYFERNGFNVNV